MKDLLPLTLCPNGIVKVPGKGPRGDIFILSHQSMYFGTPHIHIHPLKFFSGAHEIVGQAIRDNDSFFIHFSALLLPLPVTSQKVRVNHILWGVTGFRRKPESRSYSPDLLRSYEAFTQVAESAAKVGELVGEIAAASNEQAQGIDNVNKAVSEMDKVTQQNAANAEESASASEEMNAQAEQMKGIVGDLVGIVGGQASNGEQRKSGGTGTRAGARIHGTYPAPAKVARGKELVLHGAKESSPEKAIPMHEEDFKDF